MSRIPMNVIWNIGLIALHIFLIKLKFDEWMNEYVHTCSKFWNFSWLKIENSNINIICICYMDIKFRISLFTVERWRDSNDLVMISKQYIIFCWPCVTDTLQYWIFQTYLTTIDWVMEAVWHWVSPNGLISSFLVLVWGVGDVWHGTQPEQTYIELCVIVHVRAEFSFVTVCCISLGL